MNLEQTGHLEQTELTRKKGMNQEQPEPEKIRNVQNTVDQKLSRYSKFETSRKDQYTVTNRIDQEITLRRYL
jgi:hypothetical protein